MDPVRYILLAVTGVAFGLVGALPVGAVNLICIRRTLQFGTLYGFVSGLGAAFGDGLFACITGFGFTALLQVIEGYKEALQLIGGILLISFGTRMFLTPPPSRLDDKLAAADAAPVARAMASTFALTVTNPGTLFGFTLLFAATGGLVGDHPSFLDAAFVVGGVFLGSTTWWLTLALFVGILHARINDRVVRLINHVSGGFVVLFGVTILLHLLIQHFTR